MNTSLQDQLATPIKRGDNLLGVMLATDKGGGRVFTANDFKLVMAICSQAAVAISNLQMVEALLEIIYDSVKDCSGGADQ